MKCSTSITLVQISDGNDGKDGASISIKDKNIDYLSSTSGTETPSGTWDPKPNPVKGQYLWTRTTVTYTNGTNDWDTVSYSVAYVAEDGEDGAQGAGALSVSLTKESFTIPADEDGNVDSTAWDGVQCNVDVFQGATAFTYDENLSDNGTYYIEASAETDKIQGTGTSGKTWSAPTSTVFFPSADMATVTITIYYKDFEGTEGNLQKTITLTKVKQSKALTLWFSWSSSETEYKPASTEAWIASNSLIHYDGSLIGNLSSNGYGDVPYTQTWLQNWAEIEGARTDVYKYLWCKTSENGTPFLFTGVQGDRGPYEVRQYYFSNSKETPADDVEWSDTFPADQFVNSRGYLWVRYQTVLAGQTEPDEEAWGTPILASTSIKITEDKIELGANGSRLMVGKDQIVLDAPNIIADGTINAQQLSTALLFASDMQISNRTVDGVEIDGKIRSEGYEKGMWKTGAKTGFYMDNSGYLEATNAYFRSGQMKDLTIVGGEIKGEDNPINTLMTPEDGRNCSAIPYDLTEAKHKQSEIFAWLQENSTLYTDFLTKTQITGGGDSITIEGTTYTKVARFSSNSVKYTKSVSGTANSKDDTYLFLNFPNGFINGIESDFGINDIYNNLYGTRINLYAYEGTQSQYATGKYDTIYQTMLEQSTGVTMTPWGFGPWDYLETARFQYFSGQSSRPYPTLSTPGKITYDPALASIYGSSSATLKYPNSISSAASTFSGRTITFKMEVSVDMAYDAGKVWVFTLLNDSYAISKSFSSDDGYYSDSEFVATLSNGATSSSLPKHVPFKGIQDSGGNEITDGTSLTIKNLIINGSEYGEGLLSVVGGVYYFYTNTSTLITSFTKGTYYPVASYPSISFTSIQRLKGVYVTDLYPQIDNDGNYKGEGCIGSSSQPFKEIHTKALKGLYPIGSIYLTIGDEYPDDLFGGHWVLLPAGYALWTASSGLSLTSDDDNEISAGLPNIKGSYTKNADASANAMLNINESESSYSGALWPNKFVSDAGYFSRGGTSKMVYGIAFNAAYGEVHSGEYSNLIYGKSDTVQPPAYKVKAYRRES